MSRLVGCGAVSVETPCCSSASNGVPARYCFYSSGSGDFDGMALSVYG